MSVYIYTYITCRCCSDYIYVVHIVKRSADPSWCTILILTLKRKKKCLTKALPPLIYLFFLHIWSKKRDLLVLCIISFCCSCLSSSQRVTTLPTRGCVSPPIPAGILLIKQRSRMTLILSIQAYPHHLRGTVWFFNCIVPLLAFSRVFCLNPMTWLNNGICILTRFHLIYFQFIKECETI